MRAAVASSPRQQEHYIREPVGGVRIGKRVLASSCYHELGYSPITGDPSMGRMWGGDEMACRAKPGAFLVGPALGTFVPFVNRCCVHNERRAIAGRVLMTPVMSDPNRNPVVAATWNNSWETFVASPLYRRVVADIVLPTPLPDWLARFPKGTRTALEAALRSGPYGGYDPKELRYEAFIKRELLVKHSYLKPHGSAHEPRLIQGRKFCVRITTGPWTHAFGKHYASKATEAHAYMSGKSAEWVGNWFVSAYERAARVDTSVFFLSIDHRRFDARVPVPALKKLLAVQRSCGAPSAVVEVHSKRYRKKGFTPARVFYECDGEVGSGDGDTSCGDDIINRIATAGVLGCQAWLTDDSPVSTISMSDDLSAVMPASVLRELGGPEGLKQRYAKHNFEATIICGRSLFDVDVCSARLWPVEGGGWVLGPKPGRVLSKLFWSLSDIRTERGRRRHVRGVCLGMAKNAGHVPVLRAVVSRLLFLTQDLGDVPIVRRDGFEGRVEAAEDHTLDKSRCAEMVLHLYQLPWSLLEAAEARAHRLPDAPCLIDCPVMARLAEVDWA